jgi:hypothetical protein
MGEEIKFFFHCKLAENGSYAMAEVIFALGLKHITGTIKATDASKLPNVLAKFEKVLEPMWM